MTLLELMLGPITNARTTRAPLDPMWKRQHALVKEKRNLQDKARTLVWAVKHDPAQVDAAVCGVQFALRGK